MSKPGVIVRAKSIDRTRHWTVVVRFFLATLSGVLFLLPTLQWLTQTFGTSRIGCILHPFFSILVLVALTFMFVRFVHRDIPDKGDIPWLKNIAEVLKDNEHKVADVDGYNTGQRMVFWSIISIIFVLLVTGIIIWRSCLVQFFLVQVVCYSLLIHVATEIIPMHAILICTYMVFWVEGSIEGIVEGGVGRHWTKRHRPRWYYEIERQEAEKESEGEVN